MTPGDAALAYARHGWRVFPLAVRKKRPLGRLVPHGRNDSSVDPDVITEWWREVPGANIGIATGPESGIWVLDIDGPVGAVCWWEWEAHHEAVISLAQRTGRADGGRQIVLRWPEGLVVQSRARVVPGIDVRGAGGYIVAAPSVHPSGRRYRWEGRVPIADAPDALLRMVGAHAHATERPAARACACRAGDGRTTPYGQRAADELEGELAACGRGGRDVLAYRTAVRLLELELGGELAVGEAEGVLRRALGRCGYMGDTRRQRGEAGLQRILRSARSRAEQG